MSDVTSANIAKGKLSGLGDTAEVSLHIGHKAGYARLAESLRQNLKGDSFSGTGCAGYKAVTASHFAHQGDGTV